MFPGGSWLLVQPLRRVSSPRSCMPTIPALLAVNADNEIVPSQCALDIKAQGFDIISWSLERADLRKGGKSAGFYYYFDPEGQALRKDSDM